MFFIYAVLFTFMAICVPAGLSWLLSPIFVARGHRNDIAKFIKYANHASFYQEPKAQGELRCFPSVYDEPSKTVSLIVPAYNEEDRITIMLDQTLAFMDKWLAEPRNSELTYEIIVVDDGSSDKTADVVYSYVQKVGTDTMRLVSMGINQGKGAAIRRGMLLCRGEYALMVDADGATEISDLDTLYQKIKTIETQKVIGPWEFEGTFGISIGSRAHLQGEAVATRQFYRTVLMYGLHFLVWTLCSKNVKDTQCGFKLFTRDAVRVLFPNMRLERWAFDIELIILAEKLGIPIVESAVNWQEVPGSKLIQSKLDVVTTSLTMARDMFVVRLCYLFNIWKVQDPASIILERASEASSRAG
mmetsp:Transcript_16698/g.21438  ORF Transcript_16698/g.21438 Transcript_16698/m.21438 type:complete len:358 (-) Transcript_16698:214-1287(-)